MSQDLPLSIDAAGLLVTDWCQARCRHCYVNAGPEGSRWMTPEAAAGHLTALARLGAAASGVHIGGGEPFGDFERLLAIVRAARGAGLAGVGYLETNGGWAESETLVRPRLAALAEAGMMQLSISADPYHQEFIPPGRVRLLYDVAREVLGPQGVRARRWKWLKAPEDVAAMAEDARLALFAAFLRQYPERMSGRAAEALADLAERTPVEEIPEAGCAEALLGRSRELRPSAPDRSNQDSSAGCHGCAVCSRALPQDGTVAEQRNRGTPDSSLERQRAAGAHVHIDPEGWVYPGTCAGIVLGRATAERPLDELLRAWRPQQTRLVARLLEGGPRRLMALAESQGFRPDPRGYVGKCHLCWAVRSHLVRVGAGRGELGPATVYGR
jgi:MoaA/NifB/PqqE/SkfB family radical SAM enzyme